jgi:hypothetical protein
VLKDGFELSGLVVPSDSVEQPATTSAAAAMRGSSALIVYARVKDLLGGQRLRMGILNISVSRRGYAGVKSA